MFLKIPASNCLSNYWGALQGFIGLLFYCFDFVSIQIPDRIKIIIRVFTLTQCVDYDIVLLIRVKIESVTKSLQDIKKKEP